MPTVDRRQIVSSLLALVKAVHGRSAAAVVASPWIRAGGTRSQSGGIASSGCCGKHYVGLKAGRRPRQDSVAEEHLKPVGAAVHTLAPKRP